MSICAKPKVELSGALFLTRLMSKIKNSIIINVNDYYGTNSQIILCWVMSESRALETFVSNRVSEIQQNSSVANWKHVDSKENPADVASIGIESESYYMKKCSGTVLMGSPQRKSIGQQRVPCQLTNQSHQ